MGLQLTTFISSTTETCTPVEGVNMKVYPVDKCDDILPVSGVTCSVACPVTDFTLLGERHLTCGDNGTWSHALPKCIYSEWCSRCCAQPRQKLTLNVTERRSKLAV